MAKPKKPKKPQPKVATYETVEDGLKAFPAEVLKQTDAEELSLYGVFDYRKTIEIPDAIGKMTGLRTVQIGMAKIKSLPEGLCRLKNFDDLSLDYAEELQTLPKSLGSLSSLRWRKARTRCSSKKRSSDPGGMRGARSCA